MTSLRRTAGCMLLTCCVFAAPAAAQQVRVTGTATLRYIELRPLERDSIAAAAVPGTGLLRVLEGGRTVRCVPDEPYCRWTRPGDRVGAVPLMHDLEASAWGFGRGLRAYAQLRARTDAGGAARLWPQSEDALDVLAAYVELERERVRVRAGRQWQVSGLGFYNFDGINAGVEPMRGGWVEAWLGRSLLRGLNEPRTGGALASIEELAPDAPGVLMGVHTRYRHASGLAVGGAYQVEFRGDGAGLLGELAALDASLSRAGVTVDAAVEVDVATAALNEARLRVRSPPIRRVVLHTGARRYRPWFELWTIWGAFSPVGFDEVSGGATWTDAADRVLLRADAAYRSYGSAGIENPLDALHDDAWSLSAGAAWSPARRWRIDAEYRVEAGFGAARRDGHVGVAHDVAAVATLAVQALAFQRLYEFRLAEGTVYGATAEAAVRLHDRARLHAGGAIYRHGGASGDVVDWNQRRATVRLQWTLGTEPALRMPVTRP